MKRMILALCLIATQALAVNPDEQLADPVLEARARDISKGLRCVVCRNQSIDDSNAGIARDMRLLLRERLVAGDTDAEAVAFFVRRFGDFILLKPPVQSNTYLLWTGPFLIFLIAAGGFAFYLRNRNTELPETEETTDEDRRILADLLEDKA